ncbi:hypothetical protein [uncultured Roseobacter sp.]|uniref:hypothetical protein n=1 Tax=uncultured Roseobacter sp. TaxID=114847 RepID=UPI00260866E8|nr:hypothetical protein [uncultured Roseobacter sp.]
MRFRFVFVPIVLAGLVACAPQIPDSARGVGFGTSFEEQQARDAALQGSQIRVSETVRAPIGGTGAPPPVTGVSPVPGSAEATAAETTRILAQTGGTAAADSAALNSGVAPVQASPSNPAPLVINNPGISDENDFEAVAGRQTIESDAARIERNRAQYQVVEPEALPERSGSSQPNVVAFALQTTHPVGARVYSRAGLNGAARAQRNCAKYPSPDLAQIDFLERGGPARDRLGLDPDGDGYACAWDPTPFRKASQG